MLQCVRAQCVRANFCTPECERKFLYSRVYIFSSSVVRSMKANFCALESESKFLYTSKKCVYGAFAACVDVCNFRGNSHQNDSAHSIRLKFLVTALN